MDVEPWLLWELRETQREQVCGTWNMEKYGVKTRVEKKRAVLDGLVAMLRAETPDWILVQEVTNGKLFEADLRQRLAHERLPYACSGHELDLGEGSSMDHYILIYHVDKVAIVVGPQHVGANEAPEEQTEVRIWRDRDVGVAGKVLPHRGSVVWLTCALPYQGPSSLCWVMGVHTSPTGSTNQVPTQIHEIMTHGAKLRHHGVPVVLAGDFYMQKDAIGYAEKLGDAKWSLLATYYGTSLGHSNPEHAIQAADHLIVSDVCEVAWVRQFVPASSPDQRLSVTYVNTPPCTDPHSFTMRSTPEHVWQSMARWKALSIDHTPVLARFTIRPVRGRSVIVPGNIPDTIRDWARSDLSSQPRVGDGGTRPPARKRARTISVTNDRSAREAPQWDMQPFDAPMVHHSPPPAIHLPVAPQFPSGSSPFPSDQLPDGAWWPHLELLPGVQLFGSHRYSFGLVTRVRLPAIKQHGPADCGIHAAYNAMALRDFLLAPGKAACQQLLARLADSDALRLAANGWTVLRAQLARTQGLHLAVIGTALGQDYMVLPLLRTNDATAVFEQEEEPRVKACVMRLGALRSTFGACVFVAGRVQDNETHALAGILRTYPDSGRAAWEIIFTDSAPLLLFDAHTKTLFDTIAKWLEAPDRMLERSRKDMDIKL